MTTETTKHTPTGKCECQWDEHFEDRPVPRTVRHAYKGPGAEARPAAGRYVLERTRLSEVRAVSDPPQHGCPPGRPPLAPDRVVTVLCTRCLEAEVDPSLRPKFGRICRRCYRAWARAKAAKRRQEGTFRPSREAKLRSSRKRSRNPERKRQQAARAARLLRDPMHRPRILARAALRWAVRSGRIVRQPCQRCGEARAEGHHDDYAKPFEVRWLCGACHRSEHQRRIEGE